MRMADSHTELKVHKLEDGSVAVFSRNSEDMSKKYPDLVEQLPHVGLSHVWAIYHLLTRITLQCVKDTAKTFVLDTEAVAYDVKEDKLMPFQELSKRKRKDVKIEDIQVRVCLFAFDLLYLNGEVSMHMPFCSCEPLTITINFLLAITA